MQTREKNNLNYHKNILLWNRSVHSCPLRHTIRKTFARQSLGFMSFNVCVSFKEQKIQGIEVMFELCFHRPWRCPRAVGWGTEGWGHGGLRLDLGIWELFSNPNHSVTPHPPEPEFLSQNWAHADLAANRFSAEIAGHKASKQRRAAAGPGC